MGLCNVQAAVDQSSYTNFNVVARNGKFNLSNLSEIYAAGVLILFVRNFIGATNTKTHQPFILNGKWNGFRFVYDSWFLSVRKLRLCVQYWIAKGSLLILNLTRAHICVQTAIENINSRFQYTIEFQMVGYAVRNVPKYDSIRNDPQTNCHKFSSISCLAGIKLLLTSTQFDDYASLRTDRNKFNSGNFGDFRFVRTILARTFYCQIRNRINWTHSQIQEPIYVNEWIKSIACSINAFPVNSSSWSWEKKEFRQPFVFACEILYLTVNTAAFRIFKRRMHFTILFKFYGTNNFGVFPHMLRSQSLAQLSGQRISGAKRISFVNTTRKALSSFSVRIKTAHWTNLKVPSAKTSCSK